MDKFVEMANKERYDKLLRKNADLESSLTVHVHVHPVTAEHNSLKVMQLHNLPHGLKKRSSMQFKHHDPQPQ